MNRRTLLARSAALVAAGGAAGCVTDGDAGGTGTPSPTDAARTLESASLRQTDGGCGTRRDEASVGFEPDAGRVVVTGTIWGNNSCHVPELADATYDEATGVLTVTVTTGRPETDGTRGCGQCIVELGYEVTAAFTGGLPAEVRVGHDHGEGTETVATASSQ